VEALISRLWENWQPFHVALNRVLDESRYNFDIYVTPHGNVEPLIHLLN